MEILNGVSGVQQILRKDSEISFISKYIGGNTLLEAKNLNRDYFDKLKLILDSIHDKGIADIDFAHSTDLLVTSDGNPVVIDLTSAIIYDKNSFNSFLIKPFFKYICQLNKKYILKRQARFLPNNMTYDEINNAMDVGIIPKYWTYIRKLKISKFF